MNSSNTNPYEQIYLLHRSQCQKNSLKKNTEEQARHVGFLHNTLGMATKDLILMMSKNEENNEWEMTERFLAEKDKNEKKSSGHQNHEMEDEVEIISSNGGNEAEKQNQEEAEKPLSKQDDDQIECISEEKFKIIVGEQIQDKPKILLSPKSHISHKSQMSQKSQKSQKNQSENQCILIDEE